MFWYPENHSEAAIRFWSVRPSRTAYFLSKDEVRTTTVYESPSRPYWYSLDTQIMGMFGSVFFDSEIQAVEHLMAALMEEERRIDEIVDALADRYNELLLVEEKKEHELSAEYADVEAR